MSNATWENWAGNLYAYPAQLLAPTSVAELQQIIAQNQGKKIRVAGTGHSWSPLVPTDSILIDPTNITENGAKAWRWQQDGMNLVTFLPSAHWSDVRDALTDSTSGLPRMYLPTAGVLPSINATGFMAAGCHGTGWNQPTVPDLIHSIEIVAADGKVHVFTEGDTPDEMNMVRVNLGMLGIITKITVKVEEMFRLHDRESIQLTADVMGPNPDNGDSIDPSKLANMVTSNDYVELFWFPWSGWKIFEKNLSDGSIWVKQWNRTNDPPHNVPAQMPDWQIFFADFLMEKVAENTPKGSTYHAGIPPIEKGVWEKLESSINNIGANGFVGEAPDVFHYQDQAFPVIDLEIAIPIPSLGTNQWDFSNVVKAWYQIVNEVRQKYNDSIYPLTACMHARFIKNSQALLSPAHEPMGSDTHYCWIEFLSAYPKGVEDSNTRDTMMTDYVSLRNQIASNWIGTMNGRPHWGKYWQDIPGVDVKSLYPSANLSQFNSLRRQLDPQGMFMNQFLSGLNLFSS